MVVNNPNVQASVISSVTLELVGALCNGAAAPDVLRQGQFVREKVEQARRKAARTKQGVIWSKSQTAGLLDEPDVLIEATDFEVAQTLLRDEKVLATASAISPSTDPLVAFVGISIAIANHLQRDPPSWVAREAHPILARRLAENTEVTSRSIRDLEEVLPQIVDLARNGQKFRNGRKKKGRGPLWNWIARFLKKNPRANNEQLWLALVKAKPNWVVNPRVDKSKRQIWIGNRPGGGWRNFTNTAGKCRKELEGH